MVQSGSAYRQDQSERIAEASERIGISDFQFSIDGRTKYLPDWPEIRERLELSLPARD
ncbi:MAG: hypothetical protein KDA86_15855 [Planctomycetaceae bacterium]|nr:hypothetical protein [Planctomycetaceae bacterium]MCA9111586.1 hypothetical protein [Planctomycetaceae bacterium]